VLAGLTGGLLECPARFSRLWKMLTRRHPRGRREEEPGPLPPPASRPCERAREANLTGTPGVFARFEGSGDEPPMAEMALARALTIEAGGHTPEPAS
jgi:hypothetical protein